jgi:hypothetical protein
MNMDDKQLDQLLAGASKPRLSAGFNDRLLQRLSSEVASNIIPFPTRKPAQKTSVWPLLLPLVASMAAALVGGLYLGAANNFPIFMSNSSVVASVDDSDLTGFEELDTILQDSQS